MPDSQLIHVNADLMEAATLAACRGLSDNSKRAYQRAIRHFLAWWAPQSRPFDRLAVSEFMDGPGRGAGDGAASHNQSLAALKRLAREAAANGWLDWPRVAAIESLSSRPQRGVRVGIWLTRDQASQMLAAPDLTQDSGLRDSVVLSLLIGCGLRRDEACRVTFGHLRMIEGRQHIVNLKGKGNRIRTIRLPDWTARVIAMWQGRSGLKDGPILRSYLWDGSLNGSLSPSAVHDIVSHYARQLGFKAAPHDMRRTFAKLARKGGARLETIQRSLGHSSLTTTEKYVNSGEDADAGDYLNL